MIDKKFDKLFESNFQRFQGGGILTGDVVNFIDNILDDEWVKEQQPNMVEKLKSMIDSGNNIRVSAVKALRPAVAGGVQQDQQPDDHYVDVVSEIAPGSWVDFITVPSRLVTVVDLNGNLAPIPDNQRREDTSHIKPVEPDLTEGDDETNPSFGTHSQRGDRKLQNKNVNIAKKAAAVDNFTTKLYME